MIRAQSIVLLLPLVMGAYVPSGWSMEVDLPELPPQRALLKEAVKKVGGSLKSGGRISHGGVSKQFTTTVIKAKGKLGERTFGTPIKLRLSVSGRPVINPGRLDITPIVEMKASKPVSRAMPGIVEMIVTSRPENDSSLFLKYRLSF